MFDCAVDVVLVNPLENTVKLGNSFLCLFQFFLFPLYCLFCFCESLLIDGIPKALYVFKEHSRYCKYPLKDKLF